jgi:hypothetical protein
MGILITFLGLLISLIGVTMIYVYSKIITGGNVSFFEAEKWHYSKRRFDFGIKITVIGAAFQLIGAAFQLIRF